MKIDSMKTKLSKMLNKERLKHSINTSVVARELALKYGCDANKAEIAGLLHDCAKNLNFKTSKMIIKKNNIKVDEIIQIIPKLLHPLVGAVVAEKEFDITDPIILQAIRVHSTGAADMSNLDKIIYLSDKIEPLRDIKGAIEARKVMWQDLDQALLIILNSSLLYLISDNLLIHPFSIEARNNILSKVARA